MVEDEIGPSAEIIPLFAPHQVQLASPQESLRLLRAFLAITDPVQRSRVLEDVEALAERNDISPA